MHNTTTILIKLGNKLIGLAADASIHQERYLTGYGYDGLEPSYGRIHSSGRFGKTIFDRSSFKQLFHYEHLHPHTQRNPFDAIISDGKYTWTLRNIWVSDPIHTQKELPYVEVGNISFQFEDMICEPGK